MPRRKEVPKGCEYLTPSEYKYILNYINQVWGWNQHRKAAKLRAVVGPFDFRCEACNKQPLPRKGVEIDHIQPVVNPAGWDGWDNLIKRKFVSAEGLQVLCRDCHTKKSTVENAERRRRKRNESKV
jgi:5-methylcytosine-specific restriction endonuclease McrA